MASEELWKLFAATGDVRLYLLYREETARELTPDVGTKQSAQKRERGRFTGESPRG